MTDNSIILPIIAHLFLAVLLICFWRNVTVQRWISAIGNVALLGISIHIFSKAWTRGILTMQAGNWEAPFGITFVADVFSATMLMLTAVAGLAVGLFSTVGIKRIRLDYGYFPIFHFLLMGLNGAFLTGDIFNLYVWFEIIIISSFVLMTLGGRRPQMGGAIKYVTINLLASMIFLTAIAILYGLTGSLNMAHLSQKVAEVTNRGLVNISAMLFFVGFGIKSAVFPLYFWLPASYHKPPSAIAAIFAGLLTKVGVYALLRIFTLVFIPDAFISTLIMVIGTATLLTGAFGAIIKRDIRRLFSYLIICHIGYMIVGLGMYTEVAIAGAISYIIHDIVVKTNLFLVSGLIYKMRGSMRFKEIGGLYTEYPRISFVMAIVLFSLAGIPPLSGFWPKIFLVQAAMSMEAYYIVVAIIVASFVTLFVIARMWSEVFWKDNPHIEGISHNSFNTLKPLSRQLLVTPVVMLAIVSLYIGLGAEHIMAVSKHVAAEMVDTRPYINAVLKIKQ